MQPTVITHVHNRRNRRRTAVIVLLCYCGSLLAAPGGGQIIGGSGTISQSGALTQIHQNSERLAIDWQRFDVAADERVQFLQPSAQAIALNRILDTKASTILGRVDANGKLFLVNPRGLVFGKGSVINAAALVATDLDIDPNKFMEGNYHFVGDDSMLSSGVINQGAIEAAVGGSVTLLGTVISNEGQIRADQGSVNLVAANEVVVSFEPEGQVGLLVNRALLTNINGNATAVSNSGEIIATGGQVLLAGHVASDLYSQAVNNEGIIEAKSMETSGGYIALLGEGATVTNSGELNVFGTGGADGGEVLIMAGDIRNSGAIDASGSRGGSVYEQASVAVVHSQNSTIDATGSDGEGGTIELYGERVALIDTTQLDASGATGGGTILVGGDYQGAGDHRSQQTVVTRDVEMKADAIDNGDGGKVIVWSDDDTYFYGDIYARGGSQSGDGGFVEVSGKDGLQFVGYVNTSAANGAMGTLLLDPTTLNIVAGNGGTNNVQVNIDGEILAGEGGASFTIDEDTLEALTSNVTLEALQAINISSMSNGVLCFHCASEGGSGSGDVTFQVTGGSPGSITMDVNDRIEVANGNLTLQVSSAAGATLTLGDLMTTGSGGITVNALASSTGTTSGNVNLTVGNVTAASGSVSLVANTTNNPGFSAASSGTATLTAGQITLNSGGNVNIDAISSSNSPFSTADSGNASAVTGAITINGAGNVTIDASTDTTASFNFDAIAGSSSVSAGAINITGAGNIDLTSSATAVANTGLGGTSTAGTMTLSSGGAANNGAGTITLTATDGITLAGNFAAGSAGNNGFFNATGDSITLSGDTSIVMRNDGSGANPIIFNTSGANSIDGGNFDLTVNPDQANIAINWANFVAGSINTLTLGHANNIYIVDGGAGAGDITFTQADLNSFTSLAAGLGFDASANVVIGNSSFNYGNVEMTAGSAINVTGDVDPGAGNFNFTANAGTDFTMSAGTTINSGNGAIAIDAGGNIALTSLTTTNATASAVAITSTGGAIIDGDTVDDVDITATSGSVNLIAANGIGDDATGTDYTLDINAAGVSASNSTANNIDLDLTGNVVLNGALTNSAAGGGLLVNASTGSLTVDSALTTANGIIDLNANTVLTMNSGSSLDAGNATINLLAANDIALTSLTTTNATASAVTVTSTGGAILDGDTVDDVDITATNGTVNLIAANGIGDDATATDYTLEINAAGVSASNSTANNIDLDLTGNVVLNGALTNSAAGGGLLVNASTGSLTVDSALTTANGIIDLAANTTLIMNSGSSLDAGNATINLLTANDIVLTSLTTTNATASAVTVTSTGGAILDGDTVDDVDITATNGTVNLIAASGIGDDATATDYTLEINAAGVSASNSAANNIDLDLVGDVTLDGSLANSAVGGGLLVNAGGSLMVNTALSTNNGVVDLAAGTALTMNAGSAIDAGNATVNLSAANNIALTSVSTTNATASAVTVASTGGAILDGDTVDDVNITATNGTVNLIAANGIGDDASATDYTLEINAADVSATNSTANNIDLDLAGNIILDGALTNSAAGGGLLVNASTGSLTVDSVLTTTNGIIDLSANTALTMNAGSAIDAGNATVNLFAANNITLTSVTTTNATASAVTVTTTGGSILDGDTIDDVDITATSGTVNLIAANGIGDDTTATDYTLEINASGVSASNSTANNIDLDLTGNVTLNGVLTNSAAGGGLLANASTGSLTVDSVLTTADGIIDLTANTALTMNAGSSLDAGNATINLLAANDIVLTSLTTTNNTASAVSVTTTGGSILDGDTVDDVDITATSGTVNLTAANGIGTFADPLDLDTASVAASTGSGHVMLTNVGNLSVVGLDTTSGDVNVSAGGNLLFDGSVSTGSGGVTLAAATDITVNNSVTTANGNVRMDAGDHLTLAATGSVSAGGGDVILIADSGISDGVGALSIAAGGTVSGNDVSLQSAQTMSVTGIQGSSVTLTSGADIVDANAAALDITVTDSAGALTLNAATGVGVGDALETDTRLLVLASDVAQEITNTGNVAVSGLGSHSGGNVTVATTGDLTLATTVITDSSALDLTAGGAVNASALNSGGAVSVTATDLNIGSASMNSLTTVAATNVATSLATTAAMTSGNLLLAANASVTSGDVLSAGSLTLANSGNATVTSTGDMNFTGISGTGSHLTLNSAANMTLGTVALGAGNFTAQVDSDANTVATLSAAAVSAGNIALSGGVDSNDVLQISGQMDGNDISVSGFGNLDLQRIVALGMLSLQGQTISLADDLQSRNGLYVFGDTTLVNNISLDSTGGGAVSGSKLELEGNWSGSGFDLALNAGSHVACTTGASLSGIDNFVITDSIKTVLGQVSANSIDVRSSQEIHLNESVTANTVVFNADSNGDGIGLLSVLTGRSINTPSLTLVGSTVQVTASTAANCDFPSGLPTIPNPQLDFRAIVEVVQEAERFEETTLETFASNAPNVTYLDSSCHPNRRGTKMHHECALDESVRNFLGTFLIDFQLPTN